MRVMQAAEARGQERERRLEAHGVLGERGLLHLHVDGVAVERGCERHAIFEVGGVSAVASRVDVIHVGGAHRALGIWAGGSAGLRQRRAEIEIARLIAGRVRIREIAREQLRCADRESSVRPHVHRDRHPG